MKNLKKTFAIVLTIAMLMTLFMVPVAAVEQTAAEKLETLKILVGSGSGVTPEYLASPATRITSAILLLKLKGMITDAEAWNGSLNFADVNLALSFYAKTIMGYLKNNPGFGFVGYNNMFDPNTIITAQMYYKVLLTAVGYEQGVDFEWANVISFAASKGMDAIAGVTELTINDFAIATVEALDLEVKGTGMTLIEKLVDDGVVDINDAASAGWVFTPAIQSVMQVSKNEIDVYFTTTVDTSTAVVELKQGVVVWPVTVAWDTAKQVATITSLISPIAPGTYTVEVTGIEGIMTMDVVITTPTATSIMITTENLYSGSTEITYTVYDQFGDAIPLGFPALGTAYNSTDSAAVALAPTTTKFTFAAQTVGDVVMFTVVYNTVTVSKTFVILDTPAPNSLSFSPVLPLPGDAKIYISKTGYILPYTLYDQYMVETKLTAHTANADTIADVETIDGILFLTSNAAIVDPDTFVVDATGVLMFNTGATAGTATITALKNAVVIATTNITVNATSAPATAVITPPVPIIASGESVSLVLTIQDQYGVTLDNSNVEGSLTLSNDKGTVDINDTSDLLDLTFTSSGTATITIKLGATIIGSIALTIQAQAVATSISAISTPVLFEVGASDTIAIADVTVWDQYGRAFIPTAIILSEVSDTSNAVTVAVSTITATANAGVATLKLTADASATAIITFNVTVVASVSIVNYELTPMGPVQVSSNPAYFATPILIGKTAGDMEVVLANNLDYDALSSSILPVAMPNGLMVQGVSAGTAVITAYKGGIAKATGIVTVVNETLVATTVTIATTALTTSTIASVVTVLDQFGVVMVSPSGTYYVDGIATSGAATFGTTGTKTVQFIASNGANGSGSVVVS